MVIKVGCIVPRSGTTGSLYYTPDPFIQAPSQITPDRYRHAGSEILPHSGPSMREDHSALKHLIRERYSGLAAVYVSIDPHIKDQVHIFEDLSTKT